ncbi:MAG: hypothetical protein HDQ95_05920 [Roseburia sp.]|nr:hypothetical protein [Roseburia sp.]
MRRWSAIRHKLEEDYLAEALRGHIQYFVTSYSYSPDHEGRAAIRLDGKEILSGNYWNQWYKAHLYPHDEKYEYRMKYEMPFMDDVAMDLGLFDQRCFYRAFEEFDNQSIEESLASENLLIKVLALLDRRIGKRRLVKMKSEMETEPVVIQMFYAIRMEAEGIG